MQRWIYERGWTSLHDAQERAIGPIIDGDRDVIIAAPTASGKTEAVFLPILSGIAGAERTAPAAPSPWRAYDPWEAPSSGEGGVRVLYVSPLKALINDQYRRLGDLCGQVDLPVHRWHGDVAASSKRRLLSDPSGVLLITPESLEAIFVNRGAGVADLFAGLRYVVIDELHSFLATPRGAQLQSLINRIESAVRRRPTRVGLSATLGEFEEAAAFLRPAEPAEVLVVESATGGGGLKLQLRGYFSSPPAAAPEGSGDAGRDEDRGEVAIAEHMFRHLRGQDNLVFANARNSVEIYADRLARMSNAERVPNEFWPHHGNLSRNMRETVEAHLKDTTRPATAVCTSTLELGIDIGSVASIAQIGPPPSVAALRQRAGRSGRRGNPAVLRLYITERRVEKGAGPVDAMRCAVVRATAMVRLMLAGWLEAPSDPGFNYSTLIQQILSTIAQHGGATAADLYRALCGPGPFRLVDRTRFVRLLRAMAARDLVTQASDGLLLHGETGERQVNHYSFYAAFQTPSEWRLMAGGKDLGTVPIRQPLYEGVLLIFGGKRWKVIGIDTSTRVIDLEPSSGGDPPQFHGSGAPVSDRVREEMVTVYRSSDTPAWLDPTAQRLLAEGRKQYHRYGLGRTAVLDVEPDLLLFPWLGDPALFTATIALGRVGLDASVEGPAIRIRRSRPEDATAAIRLLLASAPPEAGRLASSIRNRSLDKWDWVLDGPLSCESAGARLLDVGGAWKVFERVTGQVPAGRR